MLQLEVLEDRTLPSASPAAVLSSMTQGDSSTGAPTSSIVSNSLGSNGLVNGSNYSTTGSAAAGGAAISGTSQGLYSTGASTMSIASDSVGSNGAVSGSNSSTTGSAATGAATPNSGQTKNTLEGGAVNGTSTMGNAQPQLYTSYGTSTPTTPSTSGTPIQQWLNRVYEDLLDRPIDATSLAVLSDLLAVGATPTEVVQDIELTPEYQTDEINAAYQQLLGSAAPSSTVTSLIGLMDEGVNFQTIEAALAGSTQFYEASGGSTTGFLNALYEDFLGRPIDSTSESEWSAMMAAGYTPTEVADGVLSSQEYLTNMVNNDYQTYWGSAADPTSLSDYVTALADGSTNNATIVADLLGSLAPTSS